MRVVAGVLLLSTVYTVKRQSTVEVEKGVRSIVFSALVFALTLLGPQPRFGDKLLKNLSGLSSTMGLRF